MIVVRELRQISTAAPNVGEPDPADTLYHSAARHSSTTTASLVVSLCSTSL